jgi:ABC-type dipeptide/oligopeptide/nickel transport system permease component
MAKYVLVRLLYYFPTAVAALFVVFGLAKLVPGDPVSLIVGQLAAGGGQGSAEMTQAMLRTYGLDRPFLVQFGDYLGHIVRLDFGQSIVQNLPINQMLARSLPISAELGGAAIFILIVLGIPLGTLAALKNHTWVDTLIVGTSIVFRAVPVFVMGPIVLAVFALWLHLTDVPYGWHGLFNVESIIPVFLLAAPVMALIIQETRAGVMDVLANDYVRTAHGKGLRPMTVVFRHILRNALIPVVTSLGVVLAYTITNTVYIDMMFSIPGFGSMYWGSIQSLDYPVLLATTVFVTFTVIVSNLLVDILYRVLDPRIRYVGDR